MEGLNWTYITVAFIIGLAWIIVAYNKNACKHQWENVGKPTRWEMHHRDIETNKVNFTTHTYKQNVRCTLCGTNSSQVVGGDGT